MQTLFSQDGYRVRFDWAAEGLDALAGSAVLVVVDVLSFSTAATIAAERGAAVLPLRYRDEAQARSARERGAVLAGERSWTLRPSSLADLDPGVLLGLPSPNGATLCAAAARLGTRVLIGCLRNAAAVAARAAELGGTVGVLAAGERWGGHEGPLRPSVEDQLGAGAVIAALTGTQAARSPEAQFAAAGFSAVRDSVAELLRESVSGRELAAAGHARDVGLAAELDATTVVPELREGVLRG